MNQRHESYASNALRMFKHGTPKAWAWNQVCRMCMDMTVCGALYMLWRVNAWQSWAQNRVVWYTTRLHCSSRETTLHWMLGIVLITLYFMLSLWRAQHAMQTWRNTPLYVRRIVARSSTWNIVRQNLQRKNIRVNVLLARGSRLRRWISYPEVPRRLGKADIYLLMTLVPRRVPVVWCAFSAGILSIFVPFMAVIWCIRTAVEMFVRTRDTRSPSAYTLPGTEGRVEDMQRTKDQAHTGSRGDWSIRFKLVHMIRGECPFAHRNRMHASSRAMEEWCGAHRDGFIVSAASYARFVAACGLMVCALASFVDDDALLQEDVWGRNLLWWSTCFGAVWCCAKPLIGPCRPSSPEDLCRMLEMRFGLRVASEHHARKEFLSVAAIALWNFVAVLRVPYTIGFVVPRVIEWERRTRPPIFAQPV